MSDLKGLCHICGKVASHTCKLCGRPCCSEHYVPSSGICTSHLPKRPQTKRTAGPDGRR